MNRFSNDPILNSLNRFETVNVEKEEKTTIKEVVEEKKPQQRKKKVLKEIILPSLDIEDEITEGIEEEK